MSYLKIKKAWDQIPSSQVTPESSYVNRRRFLKNLGFTGMGLPMLAGCTEAIEGPVSVLDGPGGSTGPYRQVPQFWVKQWKDFFPAAANARFKTKRGVTDEKITTGYNNFYEFTTTKPE